MNKILGILSMMLLMVSLQAQNDAKDFKDPKAKAILDKISNELSTYKSVEMDFDFELNWPGQEPEIQEGKIIQQGDKYFVDMAMQSVYCDGKSLWVHLKNNKEVQWNNASAASEGGFMDPNALINLYKSGDFAYAITNEASEDNEKILQIEFRPLTKDYPYQKLRLTIAQGKNKVKRMKVFSNDGSRYTMIIKDLKANQNYGDDTFVFNKEKFPGVHVEDLRID